MDEKKIGQDAYVYHFFHNFSYLKAIIGFMTKTSTSTILILSIESFDT